MVLIAGLLLILLSPLATLAQAAAVDVIWGIAAPRLGVDPGIVVWFAVLMVWSVFTHGLKRTAKDGKEAWENRQKWAVLRAYVVVQARYIIAAWTFAGLATTTRLMLGW